MDGKTHRLGGITAGVATASFLATRGASVDFLSYGLIIYGGALGGLIPDIDHPNSTISKRHKTISKFVTSFTKHRGITHTLLGVGAFFLALLFLSTFLPVFIQYYAMLFSVGVFVGLLSHLLLDIITRAGLRLFYPFSLATIRIAKLNQEDHAPIVRATLLIALGGCLFYFFDDFDQLKLLGQNSRVAIDAIKEQLFL